MTRGELIDALCAADSSPSPNNVRLLKSLEEERAALADEARQLRERSESAESSRGHFADLFDQAPVAYLVLDRSGTIQIANAAAATLFCTGASSLEGTALSRVAVIDEPQVFLDHVARCMDERVRTVAELKMNVRGRGEIAVQLVSTPRPSPNGWVDSVRTVVYDVTRTRRAADIAQFLVQVNDFFGDAVDPNDAAAAVARACVPVLGDAAFVDLCEDDGVFARRASTALSAEHAAMRETFDTHANDAAWRRYVEHVVKTRAPVFEPTSAAAFGAAISAKGFILVPLASRERVVGVLGALRIDGRGYSLEELELAQNVARRAARAIDDARAHVTRNSSGSTP
jgi:PAS domain S-box-containing protein